MAGRKRPLRGLVQLLCLVKDQQVAVLAASAVAGAGQKLDAGTAFQDDLLPAKRRFDLGHVAAQLWAFKKARISSKVSVAVFCRWAV